MVSGDVFRAPPHAMLLCVQLGSGVQIITSGFITLFFAALGALRLPRCAALQSGAALFAFVQGAPGIAGCTFAASAGSRTALLLVPCWLSQLLLSPGIMGQMHCA